MMKKLLALLLLLGGCSDLDITEISPVDLKPESLILDVRTVEEHRQAALEQKHFLIPLNQLNAADFIREHHLDDSKPLYLLCRSGKRAAIAAKQFKKAGLKNVVIIRGGILAAEQAGLKVIKEL